VIDIQRVSIEYKSVLRNLLELYKYDFSEYGLEDVDEHGLYGYKYLDHYWTEDGRYPYLIQVDGKLAGFALVRTIIKAEKSTMSSYHDMCEFFIMKKYRRLGIGIHCAFKVFDMHSGEWQVAQIEENKPAQGFWRKVVSEYTSGNYEEIRKESWNGPIQKFYSKCNKI
jgi:predicted acetyltransferase